MTVLSGIGTVPILWATYKGQLVGDGRPIKTVLAADIVTREIDQFSPHSVTCAASDQATILAMKAYTLIEIEHPGRGTIGWGYVINPRYQLSPGSPTEDGQRTVVLQLIQLAAVELMQRNTHRGWIATNNLGTIFDLLVTGVPPWTSTFTDWGQVDEAGFDLNPITTIRFPALTHLNAILQFAKKYDAHVRMGPVSAGTPNRNLQMGRFQAAPTMYVQDPRGVQLDEVDDMIKIVASIDYQPNDVTNHLTVCTPFGGGSDDASVVTLERLWAILNDPSYENWGRYGTDADSIARTGKVSLFKEYDPNYPISDPENLATGAYQWLFLDTDGNPLPNIGYTVQIEYDSHGDIVFNAYYLGNRARNIVVELLQGAGNTRYPTKDGHWDYMVYDKVAYDTYGFIDGPLINSNLNYTDQNPANQELTEIGLYLSAIANFKRNSHPHETIVFSTSSISEPPQAGDLIAVDVQVSSIQEDGAVVEMDVLKNFQLMQVVRHFPGLIDEYTVSNLGRFEQTDATVNAGMQEQIIAFQLRQDTSVAPYPMSLTGNCDAAHPFHMFVPIPKQLVRWRGFYLRCDFLPYTATSTTADNQTQDFTLFTQPQDILLDTPNDISLTGTFNAGETGATGVTDGFDLVQTGVDNDAVVQMIVTNDGTLVPDGQNLKGQLVVEGGQSRWRLWSSGIPNGRSVGSSMKINFTKAKTQSAFTTPIAKKVVGKFQTVARIAGTTIIGVLPKHKHPLDQRIPDGPTAASCLFAIDGQSLSEGSRLMSGTRNSATGDFVSSFEIMDLSKEMYKPGDVIDLSFTPTGNVTSNPFGCGRFQVTLMGFGEFGMMGATNVQIQ